MKKSLILALALSAIVPLSACGREPPPVPEELAGWAAQRANDALEDLGGVVSDALDEVKEAEYQGGPFDNNLESARAYLLEQLREKYGMEFTVVGHEILENYGPFAGASYSCQTAPVNAPEQVARALVSQSMYREVRDTYAVYFFKDEAEAPVLALCQSKPYVLDQCISLEMPGTARTWTPEDGLETFLSESGAYVKVVLRLEDGLEPREYAEQLLDFLNSLEELDCSLLLQAKANQTYLFHLEVNLLDGFDAGAYTLERLEERVTRELEMGRPNRRAICIRLSFFLQFRISHPSLRFFNCFFPLWGVE